MMKTDVLVISSHPDDTEIGCAGTVASLIKSGKKVGLIDLTEGELGTRGDPVTRKKEANDSAKVLGALFRENLGIPDGFVEQTEKNLLSIVRVIRQHQPEIVMTNAPRDRHPDHGNGGALVSRAAFLSGLVKIKTELQNNIQDAWRPKQVYHYIQDRYIEPDFVVDISAYWEKKLAAILSFRSQFYNPDHSGEPETYISSEGFLKFLEGRALELGHSIGVKYGEGFITDRKRYVGVKDLFDLI